MCGIAGIIRFDDQPVSRDEISRMTCAIAHRGPDGEGLHLKHNLALGHRRLSIIDLAGSAQPMCNEDGSIWITFNGEIYNYRSLREELHSFGHTFKTAGDTEVIVHAYEQWGEDCVQRLHGMFAFAIADYRRCRLWLARDPIGIKPLLYRVGSGFFAFGSELAALRAVDAPHPNGDLTAVEQFLRFGYIPAPQTIFQDCHKLPPAHTLSVDFDGTISAPKRYWQWDWRCNSPQRSEREWLEQFDSTLDRIVRGQLVADVPFGVFLSGGIDSTLVACAMHRVLDIPIKGFTIAFDESEWSELPYAKQVADQCGFELIAHTVREDAWQQYPDLLSHVGEPFADNSLIATWEVARLARQHVPMVLSGDGGDEGFAGYHSHAKWRRPDVRTFWRRLRFKRSREALTSLLAAMVRRFAGKASIPAATDWQHLMLNLGNPLRQSLWRRQFADPLLSLKTEAYETAHASAPHHDAAGYAQHVDLMTYLPGDILAKVDLASMAHGLEVRPAPLDLELLELAGTLPQNLRLRPGSRSRPDWQVLAQAIAAARVSPDFVHRRKQGFVLPAERWLQTDAAGGQLLRDVLLEPGSRIGHWFNREAINGLLAMHATGRNKSVPLWTLLTLGLWLRANPEIDFEDGFSATRTATIPLVKTDDKPAGKSQVPATASR
jgi:asparagine synthase (glutamine-hydrolysing)